MKDSGLYVAKSTHTCTNNSTNMHVVFKNCKFKKTKDFFKKLKKKTIKIKINVRIYGML